MKRFGMNNFIQNKNEEYLSNILIYKPYGKTNPLISRIMRAVKKKQIKMYKSKIGKNRNLIVVSVTDVLQYIQNNCNNLAVYLESDYYEAYCLFLIDNSGKTIDDELIKLKEIQKEKIKKYKNEVKNSGKEVIKNLETYNNITKNITPEKETTEVKQKTSSGPTPGQIFGNTTKVGEKIISEIQELKKQQNLIINIIMKIFNDLMSDQEKLKLYNEFPDYFSIKK